MDDRRYMKQAFREARRAEREGEVPVGAILVDADGEAIIGRGHNLTIARHDPTAHAEIIAMRRAGRRLGNYRLTDTTLFVTLEPCLMCLGAIAHARVSRIVYAADDPKRGAMGAARLRRVAQRLHHEFDVTGGFMAEEGAELLRDFFRPRRLARTPAR